MAFRIYKEDNRVYVEMTMGGGKALAVLPNEMGGWSENKIRKHFDTLLPILEEEAKENARALRREAKVFMKTNNKRKRKQ